jgi:hypothetical protein
MAAFGPSEPVLGSTINLITERTEDLRAIDHRSGGGSCLDAALTLIYRARQLPQGCAELNVALADLHILAGSAGFDIGLTELAITHFGQAMAFAGRGRDHRILANVLYRLGLLRLHHADPVGALVYFDVGQLTAARSGTSAQLEASILSANQAWAHATMGAEDEACVMLDRSTDQFTEAAGNSAAPGCSRFITRNELRAMVGVVHAELARRVNARHAAIAIPALTEAIQGYGKDMARSRTLCLIMLAVSHFLDGDPDRGVESGFQALAGATDLASVQVRDRMAPLKVLVQQHDAHRGARELTLRITAFTTYQASRP